MLRGCPSSTLVYISVPEDRDASPRFFMRLAAIQGRMRSASTRLYTLQTAIN
jgi:hypothetical protein